MNGLIDVTAFARSAGFGDRSVALTASVWAKVRGLPLDESTDTEACLLNVLRMGQQAIRRSDERILDFDVHLPGGERTYTRLTLRAEPEGVTITLPDEDTRRRHDDGRYVGLLSSLRDRVGGRHPHRRPGGGPETEGRRH